MKVISEWWESIKDHEGMLQILGSRDQSGKVRKGYLVDDSTEQLTLHWQDCIKLYMFYNGSEEEARKNFQKFYDLSE